MREVFSQRTIFEYQIFTGCVFLAGGVSWGNVDLLKKKVRELAHRRWRNICTIIRVLDDEINGDGVLKSR